MLIEVKVPPLAESVIDATLMSWYKQPGQSVERGENLIDLETDKVTLEVTAPESGVLKEVLKNEGESAVMDDVLAIIDTEGVAAVAASGTAQAAPSAAPPATPADSEQQPKMGPAVRKLVAENELDPKSIATEKEGRVSKSDVVRHLHAVPEKPTGAEAAPAGPRTDQRVPMTRLRKAAAQRLLSAQQQNALLTTFNEVNMAPVMALRRRYQEQFEKTHGVRLGFMSLFTKAALEALKRFPVINASVDGDDIIYHGYFDIGIAVSAPRGLVVPIVRDADQQSLADLEKNIRELSVKARDGKLSIDDLTGGTFTITNGGVFGSLLSTPIINPPQSAILGMHKIQERPMAENGQVVIRPMMYLALSYDHRIIDGREAVQFLVTIKEQLEDPARMLLGI
jgi:2-oxoglutarate dehydrogenase E2 component (dihydrolipoamide succinyltransferase)